MKQDLLSPSLHPLFSAVSTYLEKHYLPFRLLFEDDEGFCDCISIFKKADALENKLKQLDDSFAVSLLKWIDRKQMNEVDCYKKARVGRNTWYKIMNQKEYHPSKNTVLCFAVSLELTLSETEQLLKTAGYSLSHSDKFDVIIEFFLVNGIYDMMKINEVLFAFEQPLLWGCTLSLDE